MVVPVGEEVVGDVVIEPVDEEVDDPPPPLEEAVEVVDDERLEVVDVGVLEVVVEP